MVSIAFEKTTLSNGLDVISSRAVRDLLRLRPFFSIEQWASQFPDPDDAAQMVIGLETAGLGKSIEEE